MITQKNIERDIEFAKAQNQQLEMLLKISGLPTLKEMFGEKKEVVEMTEEEYKDYFGAYDKHVEMEENKSKDENL